VRRSRVNSSVVILCFLSLISASSASLAADPFLNMLSPEQQQAAPAPRYARMSRVEALAELKKRGVSFVEVPEGQAPGVKIPIRLSGALRGVSIHGAGSEQLRQSSPYEILDARLALSLDDFAQILAKHDIVEVMHYTMYRPAVPKHRKVPKRNTKKRKKYHSLLELDGELLAKKNPANKTRARGNKKGKVSAPAASKKPAKVVAKPGVRKGNKVTVPGKLAVKRNKHSVMSAGRRSVSAKHRNTKLHTPGQGNKLVPKKPAVKHYEKIIPSAGQNTARHPAGLAIDVGWFRKKDGTLLSVAHDFHGKIGDQTCGIGAPVPGSEPARELRSILCEAAEKHVFTYVLTPNYNQPHQDHWHMEIKGGVPWEIYH
jgi:hypothetical protein